MDFWDRQLQIPFPVYGMTLQTSEPLSQGQVSTVLKRVTGKALVRATFEY